MDVSELNQEQLEELRSRWYDQHLDDGSLNEVMGKKIESEDEIPMDIITTYYAETYFVEDDFFCTMGTD